MEHHEESRKAREREIPKAKNGPYKKDPFSRKLIMFSTISLKFVENSIQPEILCSITVADILH